MTSKFVSAASPRAGLERGVHLGAQRSDRILGEHADDRVGLAPEQDGPPKDALVGAEDVAPQL